MVGKWPVHVTFVLGRVVLVVTILVQSHDSDSAFHRVFDNRSLASAILVTFKTPPATLSS